MSDPRLENEEEKPLDPAAERLRRKMQRLMIVSFGTMFIGIFAVLFAIVYKLNNSAVDAAVIDTDITVPDGFSITDTVVDDGTIYLRGSGQNGTQAVLVFDLVTGESRGRISIK